MSADVHCFQPVEPFTIFGAMALKKRLLEELEAHPEALEIDLSDVGEIDTAGVQLLLMLKREAVSRDCAITFRAFSPQVRELLDLFGLSADFQNEATGSTDTSRGSGG